MSDPAFRTSLESKRRELVARGRAKALRLVAGPDAALTFSQEGEDRILARLFETQREGFYVDVGAHHPTRFSNTHLLHLRGWWGVNIDATPKSMLAFAKARPGDINLEMGVAEVTGIMRYHVFNEPALNTFSARVAESHASNPMFQVMRTVDLPVLPLAEILHRHAPPGVGIDLLSIDVEGLDLEILRSNDWDRYRPAVICVEARLEDGAQESTAHLLTSLGYASVGRTPNSQLYLAKPSR